MSGVIDFVIDFDAEVAQFFQNQFTNQTGVFTNACGKDEGVNPAHGGNVCADKFDNAVDVAFHSVYDYRFASEISSFEIAGIAVAAKTIFAAFLIKHFVYLVDAEVLRFHNV